LLSAFSTEDYSDNSKEGERERGRDELGSSGFAVVFIELFRLG
jgi:hypothetical protein